MELAPDSAPVKPKPPPPKVSHTICCGPDDELDMENEPPQANDAETSEAAPGGGSWSLSGLSGGATGPDSWDMQEETATAGDEGLWVPASTVVEPRKESMDIQTEPTPTAEPKDAPKSSYFERLFMSNASVWTTHEATLKCSLKR